MTTTQPPKQNGGKEHKPEALYDLIGEQVLHILGRPPALFKVQVRPLWGTYYRVNVFVGADAASAQVAHSYFLGADGDGKIDAPSPKITNKY
jgi:hypothetical protein